MTVASSEAVFSYGGQSAKGTLATTWYRHKASRVNIGPQQVIQQFPPEIGGGFHPTGAFKMMAFGAGQAILNPRLEDVIGWLMYAAVGQLSSVDDIPEAGMSRHYFTPPDNYYDMKWMSIRRSIPGATGTGDNVGEILLDARCVGMRIAAAPGAILTGAFTFVGREPKLSLTGVDSWSYNNTYERYPSVPLAHQGWLKLDHAEEPATNLVLDIVNQYTNPREELIIGSPYPDDFILQRQMLTATWTYKWENPDLYQALLTGDEVEAGGEIDWSPAVHTAPFEFEVTSPGNATGQTNPWLLNVYAPEFTWQAAGPPELIGGGWLALQFTGIAQEQTTGDTFRMYLENAVQTGDPTYYTWPS